MIFILGVLVGFALCYIICLPISHEEATPPPKHTNPRNPFSYELLPPEVQKQLLTKVEADIAAQHGEANT